MISMRNAVRMNYMIQMGGTGASTPGEGGEGGVGNVVLPALTREAAKDEGQL